MDAEAQLQNLRIFSIVDISKGITWANAYGSVSVTGFKLPTFPEEFRRYEAIAHDSLFQ